MNAPILFILIPGLFSLVFLFFRRFHLVVLISATISAIFLALLAMQLQIGEVVMVGNWAFVIRDELIVFGRRFVISNFDRPIISTLYFSLAFWYVGAAFTSVPRFFIPLGMSIVSVLISALAVEPILFSALLIEIAILISVLLLVPPGGGANRGVLRFLSFQTISLPFILIAGWFLSGVELRAGNTEDIVRAAIFLGFGFAFQLGIFPLHSWIPMLMEKSQSYVAAFIITILISVALFFGIGFLLQYPWLQENVNLSGILRLLGLMMVIVGGGWAAFQRHLGKLFGYAVIIEIGRTLLAMGLPDGSQLLFALTVPRILSLGIWALALSILSSHSVGLRFVELQGLGRQFPVTGAGIVLAIFSLAGLPLLAGFPVYNILWGQLANVGVWMSIGTLLASVGLLIGGLRTFAVLVMGPEEMPEVDTGWQELGARILLMLGMAMLFVMGIFPQWFLPALLSLSASLQPQIP